MRRDKKKKKQVQQLLRWRAKTWTTVGMLNTEHPFPSSVVHSILLLANAKKKLTLQNVLYIPQNACYLFVSIYLFILFVV